MDAATAMPPPSPRADCDSAEQALFQQFIPRYLKVPMVRQWLMTREPVQARYESALSTSLSYACMYFPPSMVPRGRAPYPLPQPFLDIGDFMLCHTVYDNIALGTLFNRKEEHSLAVLRDSMLPDPRYSRRPRTRRFAVDLSAPNLEVIEFAWLEDDSLIVSCRRLHLPTDQPGETELVLTGDMLFYGIIPTGSFPESPVLRMTLDEKPSICRFCGTRGIKSCQCPSTFKHRAPTGLSTPVPFAPRPQPSGPLEPIPTGPLAGVLSTWHNYTKRIFSVNQTGSFFVRWYKSTADPSRMTLFLRPTHPVSYQFVCGTRKDTIRLASSYLKRTRLCQRPYYADTRLYSYMTRGSDINMLMDKENTPAVDQLLGLTSKSNPYFDTTDAFTEVECSLPHENDVTDQYVLQSATTNPSLVTDPSTDYEYGGMSRDILTDFRTAPDTVSSYPSLQTAESPSVSIVDMGAPAVSFPVSEVTESVVFQSPMPAPPEEVTERSHVMESNFEEWGPESQIPNTNSPQSGRNAKTVLSTSSREFQQYMTSDASGTPTCNECGNSFPKKGNLARHIQTVHLKWKPFQCTECSASFGYKTHLKRHQSVHQRGTELKCSKCNREFRGQMQLTRHIQQAHNSNRTATANDGGTESAEKCRIVCDVCGVSFSQRSNLSRHMLIHEGLRFVCPICPNKLSSFGQRYDLHRHLMRKHPEQSDTAMVSLVPERVE